jgi:hypothetical protein
MRSTGTWPILLALAMAAGCREPRGSTDAVGSGSPASDSAFHAGALEALHPASMAGDTAFCDGFLPVYDDTALARLHPRRVNDAFVYIIIAHNGYPARTMQRFQRLARYAGDERMLAWHDFLIARWRMMKRDPIGAVRLYQDLLIRFERIREETGISSACRRLAQIYRGLGDFDTALPYLHRALPGEPRAEFRCNMLYAMGQCHAHAGRPDSVRWCRDRIAALAGDSMLVRRGDDRVALYRAGRCRRPGARPGALGQPGGAARPEARLHRGR